MQKPMEINMASIGLEEVNGVIKLNETIPLSGVAIFEFKMKTVDAISLTSQIPYPIP